MSELDHKEGWALKNWCGGAGEDSWESLGQEGDQSNQSQRKSTLNIHWKDRCWAEAPTVWPTDAKNRLTGKDSDAGKNWRHKKWETEDETVELYHWLNRREFEQTPGDSEGQGAWSAAVYEVINTWTRLCKWTRTADN